MPFKTFYFGAHMWIQKKKFNPSSKQKQTWNNVCEEYPVGPWIYFRG